ncbi:hypothetical protein ACFPA8_15565 [Streptomyces ovatisporus]|uniref:Uncharacterized protein n=1 Tax=Streptomyces ovatisporus TaxID=1128682 RepID=A0ABV9A959_9ACTN
MPEFDWFAAPRTPRKASVVVREALLPMLMWPSVSVTRRVDEKLTVVDRFVVEAALALAPMRVEDVEEVTAIPREAVVRIAGRLVGLGVLRASGPDYHAVEEAARSALNGYAVPRYHTTTVGFLYLPDSDELIACLRGAGRPDPPLLDRVEPTSQKPTPRRVRGLTLAGLITDRMREGTVVGLPDDIVDAVERETAVPEAGPVYRTRGHVRSHGESAMLVLDVMDPSGRKKLKDVVVPAPRQAQHWMDLTGLAPDAALPWQEQGGDVTAVPSSPTRWSFTLDSNAAEAAMGRGIALNRPTGLSIGHPDCAVGVTVDFSPADAAARWVFALDQAVRELAEIPPASLDTGMLPAAASRAVQAHGMPEESLTSAHIEEHLWDEGHFRHVYALRAAKDFAYD